MKKNVYIVEDNEDIRNVIGYILTDGDYNVSIYATATEFNTIIKSTLPDLIVLDVMLPDGNGLEICRKLKSDPYSARIPIILMSANAQKREIINATCAEDFISKPFNIDDFRDKIEYYLN